MKRRWAPGGFEVNGLAFRVVLGKHTAGIPGERDLRIDVLTPAGWRNVEMGLVFMLVDFLAENEEVLYPSKVNGGTARGSAYFIDRVRFAANYGWERAVKLLRMERIERGQQPSVWNYDQ